MDLAAEVVAEQLPASADRRIGGVDQRVPVDLVEPDRGPAPERAVRDAVDRPGDAVGLGAAQPDPVPREPGVREPVHHLGVDHHVLVGPAAVHRVHPAGRVDLGVRAVVDQAVHVRRVVQQRAHQRPGTGVLARRAAVTVQRGDRVDEQEVGVDDRVGAAAARRVPAEAAVPQHVEARLHPVHVGEVAGLVERSAGGGRRGGLLRGPGRRHERGGRKHDDEPDGCAHARTVPAGGARADGS
jgi:hypothetical protein